MASHIGIQYRPQTFADVLGNSEQKNALVGALQDDALPHALLFSGTRGSGKTTLARIVSMSLSCLEPHNGNACGVCAVCQSDRPDVVEMDAASNRGVDDIRAIRDRVALMPMQARSLVWIIDEAHMLTREAQNALLKTLEEPPEHVYFLLATTEPEKLLPTVRSRCMHIHVAPASSADILTLLVQVCTDQKWQFEEAALMLLAGAAAGSYRDALSLLSAHEPIPITVDSVRTLLGASAISQSLALCVSILKEDLGAALQGRLLLTERGHSPAAISQSLGAIVREWAYIHALGSPPQESLLTKDDQQQLADIPWNAATGAMVLRQCVLAAPQTITALDAALILCCSSSPAVVQAPHVPIITKAEGKKKPLTPAANTSAVQSDAVPSPPPSTSSARATESPVDTVSVTSSDTTVSGDTLSGEQAMQWWPTMRLALRRIEPELYILLRTATARYKGKALVVLLPDGSQLPFDADKQLRSLLKGWGVQQLLVERTGQPAGVPAQAAPRQVEAAPPPPSQSVDLSALDALMEAEGLRAADES